MTKISLTPFERLTLALQLRRLAEEDPQIQSYARQAEIIERGYTQLYGEVFGTTGEPELEASVQDEVFEILNMFRALHPGHSVGKDWNPSGDNYYQKFRGFDGNDDAGHYGFANFLISTFGRFEESAGELNSHGPTLRTYRAMLSRWKALDEPNEMTDQQVRAVIGNE